MSKVTRLFTPGPTQDATDTLIDEMKKLNIEVIDSNTMPGVLSHVMGNLSPSEIDQALESFMHVAVDLAVPDDFESVPSFSLKVRNIRTGRDVYATHFQLRTIGEQKVLTFHAHLFIPDRVSATLPKRVKLDKKVGLSFLELCFGGAAELQSTETDTITPMRPGVPYADIGWILPSRYVDTLIDALGKLNDTMFDGALRESIIYTRIPSHERTE
jgi:hypothetical protein